MADSLFHVTKTEHGGQPQIILSAVPRGDAVEAAQTLADGELTNQPYEQAAIHTWVRKVAGKIVKRIDIVPAKEQR